MGKAKENGAFSSQETSWWAEVRGHIGAVSVFLCSPFLVSPFCPFGVRCRVPALLAQPSETFPRSASGSLRTGQIHMLPFTRGWSLKCPQPAGAVRQRCAGVPRVAHSPVIYLSLPGPCPQMAWLMQ